jgi:hypothetical protein
MNDIEKSCKNIDDLRYLLQLEIFKASLSEQIGSAVTSKQVKKQCPLTVLKNDSPCLSNNPFEERKDALSKSANFSCHKVVDSNDIMLNHLQAKESPLSFILSIFNSIIPIRHTQRKYDEIHENEKIDSSEKKKAVTVFLEQISSRIKGTKLPRSVYISSQ